MRDKESWKFSVIKDRIIRSLTVKSEAEKIYMLLRRP
jgi:hypothetical protein